MDLIKEGTMPIIAHIVACKKCSSEIRSDWKFCPKCGDKIVCTGKYKSCKPQN